MWIGVAVFIFTLLIGVPIAFSLGIGSLAFLLVEGNIPLTLIAQRLFTGIDSFPFMAIPFFILAGELMNVVGITTRLVKFADVLVGHLKGGLAHVNIVTSMFFAGITGSAVADTSAIGSMLIPTMNEQGYDNDFSCAVTVSSSVIGPIIPPSIPMVVFGLISGTSVAGLFLAGLIPGILLGFGLMGVAYWISVKRDYPKNERAATIKEMFSAFLTALVPLFMPLIILGGILGGIFTATEASGVAVVYALIIGFFVYKKLNIKNLKEAFVTTAKTTGVVFLVIACSNIFNWVLATQQVPQRLTAFVAETVSSPAVLLLLINVILLVLGTFMEGTAAMILTVPILIKITAAFGIHPITLGAVVVLNLMIGLITPPVGLCLFVAVGIGKITIERLSKAVLPFLAIEIVVLLMTTYIEPITLLLPRLFGYVR
ncbi:MAG: TRAP transporter large permease [Spirochaetales bacterium]|nr:TRAP transporter large permease [Spirochaetales bacterium]